MDLSAFVQGEFSKAKAMIAVTLGMAFIVGVRRYPAGRQPISTINRIQIFSERIY
jgi:hypothetical protein